MRNGEIKPINGAWSDEANAWVSETLCLTGDCWLEITLPGKGRLVIKKSESEDGPFPKAIVSNWTGEKFRIRIYGTTENRYIKVFLTSEPTIIQLASI
jgi:hypothetical protein